MKRFFNPSLMLVTSMTIFGTIGIFVRNIPISSGELALCRAIMASFLIGIFLLITKQRIPFQKIRKEVPLLLFSGIALGINWMLLFEAYKYTTVSTATLSYYFAPVIVTVVSSLIFKEKLTSRQIICFIMSTIGLIMITGSGASGTGKDFIGILYGLGAAVFYAGVVLLNKFIKNVEGIHRTFLQFVSAVTVLLPYVIFTDGFSVDKLNSAAWINLIIVGVLHTGITYCMYFSSVKDLSGQKTAILSYIDPLVAVIISVTILNEAMTLIQVSGGALILICTLCNEIKPRKQK